MNQPSSSDSFRVYTKASGSRLPCNPKLMSSRIVNTWLHGLGRIAGVGLLVYLGTVLVFSLLENSLLYFPSRYPDGDWSLGPGLEDAWFTSADGTQLHGWYVDVAQPRAVVLFSHGNGGSIAWRRDLIEDFRSLRVSGLLWSYRGYGRSAGAPHEAGILQDARAARAWLAKRAGVQPSDVVLWGESLGGGVSVDLRKTARVPLFWKIRSPASPTWPPIIIPGCQLER